MKRHVRVIAATSNTDARKIEDLEFLNDEGLHVSLELLKVGPEFIESAYDEALCIPGLVNNAIQAEKEGVDALVIESMGDTGLVACREMVSIPVIGLSETSLPIAKNLGYKFSLIAVAKRQCILLEKIVRQYGIGSELVSTHYLNLKPLEIRDSQKVNDALFEAALKAINMDNADTLLLGGSYFIGRAVPLKKRLLAIGKDILIIDPLPTAIRYAKFIVDCGYAHNKSIYIKPGFKKVFGFEEICQGNYLE